jgi:hypothetical protein
MLTPTAAAGNQFVSWGGVCGSQGTASVCKVTVAGAMAVEARFAPPAAPGPGPTSNLVSPSGAVVALQSAQFLAQPVAGTPVSFEWSFEGSGTASCPASSPVAVHAFTRAGTFMVTLRTIDAVGNATQTSQTVTVGGTRSVPLPKSAGSAALCGHTTAVGNCLDQIDFDGAEAYALDGCFTEQKIRVGPVHDPSALSGILGQPGSGNLPLSQVSTHLPPPDPPTGKVGGQVRVPSWVGNAILGKTYEAPGRVRLDGLDIAPGADDQVVLDQRTNLVYAPHATITVAGSTRAGGGSPITLARDATVNRVLPDESIEPHHEVPLLNFPDVTQYLPQIFGFSFGGSAKAFLEPDGSVRIQVSVNLPDLINDGSGGSMTGTANIYADHNGIRIGDLDIDLKDAYLGDLQIHDLHVTYSGAQDTWEAEASVDWADQVTVTVDAGFVHGDFDHGSAAVDFTDPGVAVGPVLFLHHVDFSIQVGPPVVLAGSVAISVAGTYQTPFGDVSAVDFSGTMTFTASDPWSLDANGTESIVGIPFQSSWFHLSNDGSIGYGGRFDVDMFNLGVLTIHSDAGGVAFSDGRFQLDSHGQICLFSQCAGGEWLVSSAGAAACADVSTLVGHIHIGAGYRWGGGLDIMWDSCGVGSYAVAPQTVSYHPAPGHAVLAADVSAPPGSRQVALTGRDAYDVIGVEGTTDAPVVRVQGPDGTQVDTPSDGRSLQSGHYVIIPSTARYHTTYIVVVRPVPGTYILSPLPGSASLTQVLTAPSLPEPSVRGSVHVAGGSVTLDYQVQPQPGQAVVFTEEGAGVSRVVGAAAGAHGSIHYALRPGRGTRRVVALVEGRGGLPRTEITVARYRPPAPPRPPAPAGLEARRRGDDLVASWQRVSGATRYRLLAHLSDGRKSLDITERTEARLAAVSLGTTGTITVRSIRGDRVVGSPAVLQLSGSTTSGTGWGTWAAVGGGAAAVLAAAGALFVLRRRRMHLPRPTGC